MSSMDWLNVMAQEDAAKRKEIDDQRDFMLQQYAKSLAYAKAVQESQAQQQEAAQKAQIEAYKEQRQAVRDARADERSSWQDQARYVESERSMIYKNYEIMKNLNQAYWANVKKEGRGKVDERMLQAQAVAAATIQAVDLYQGNFKGAQVSGGNDSTLTGTYGFYSLPQWRQIQTMLKNDPVLVEQVKTNVSAYAALPQEAREAERGKYAHDLQLSKAAMALNKNAESEDQSLAVLEAQAHHSMQQLPAMPLPPGAGGVPSQPGSAAGPDSATPQKAPEANIPRGAFGGYMTVTDESGKKKSYMVPTEDASPDVRESMDMYNSAPKAQDDVEFDEWFKAKESFNDFLNSPYDDYFEKEPNQPKPIKPKGLHFSNNDNYTSMPGPL